MYERLTPGQQYRLHPQVGRSPGEALCWAWTGYVDRDGYGRFSVRDGGKQRWLRVTHLMWEWANGVPFPQGLLARHTCDNPNCVNPAHIIPGTQLENRRDAVERGRTARGDRQGHRLHPEVVQRGSQHPNAVLTEEGVLWAHEEVAKGMSVSEAARRLKASRTALRFALAGETWRHVKRP